MSLRTTSFYRRLSGEDALYERNDREHRAIQAALLARSPDGARAIARDHVLHSFRLLETVVDLAARSRRRSAAAGGPSPEPT